MQFNTNFIATSYWHYHLKIISEIQYTLKIKIINIIYTKIIYNYVIIYFDSYKKTKSVLYTYTTIQSSFITYVMHCIAYSIRHTDCYCTIPYCGTAQYHIVVLHNTTLLDTGYEITRTNHIHIVRQEYSLKIYILQISANFILMVLWFQITVVWWLYFDWHFALDLPLILMV